MLVFNPKTKLKVEILTALRSSLFPVGGSNLRYHLVKVDYGFDSGLDWKLISPVRVRNWHLDVSGSLKLILSDLHFLAKLRRGQFNLNLAWLRLVISNDSIVFLNSAARWDENLSTTAGSWPGNCNADAKCGTIVVHVAQGIHALKNTRGIGWPFKVFVMWF